MIASDKLHQRIVKITGTMLGFMDRGVFTCLLQLDYGDSSTQGAGGYALSDYSAEVGGHVPTERIGRFVVGVLRACGVPTWEQVKGRTVFALFETDAPSARPVGIRALPTEEGGFFLFEEITR